jgi:flagellar basal body rod protein FlgC
MHEMVDSISAPADIALSGLLAAQKQLNDAAVNIAKGPGTAAPTPNAAPPVTGTQPPQQSFDAAQGDLTTSVVDLINARNSFAANVDTLKVSDNLVKKLLDVIT